MHMHYHALRMRTPRFGHEFPLTGVLASRGFLGVVMDMYSYFPFGESTLDVVHTSWTFHHGFPLTALYEFHRVLRPGGYLIIRQMATHIGESSLASVRQFAQSLNWTTLLDLKGCSVPRADDSQVRRAPPAKPAAATREILDTVLAYRMPVPSRWEQGLERATEQHAQ